VAKQSATSGRAKPSYVILTLAVAAAAAFAGRHIWSMSSPSTAQVHAGAKGGNVPQLSSHPTAVTALGRLEPKDGVTRVAGPSQPSVVISQLLASKGQKVRAGDAIAVLDSYEPLKATAAALQSELDHAESEYQRHERLYQTKVVSISERDAWRVKVNTLRAELERAQVELNQATVRAPISGQILDIHARAGERVGPDGIVEIAKTDQMYAIAEVYETDIGRVHVGQRATITSPAFAEPLQGTVERIGLKIGKLEILNVDPAARTDARVVEVEVRLDDSQRAAALTNLQVEVTIKP
jgi:HlyD family secretion protein